jgi:saxitoxin biosynthesis operon SxtJ-like protein
MGLIRIEHNSSRGQLAVFSAAWLIVFGIIGGAALQGSNVSYVAAGWTAALAAPCLWLAAPGLLRRVYVGMAYLAFPIGFVVSHLVLLAIYYLVLTPVGLMLRSLRYDPMNRRFDRGARSYWIRRETADEVQQHFRQF